MMSQLIHWVRVDSSDLGRPQLPGDTPVNIMAVPMMLLCLVQQLTEERGQEVAEKYREVGDWCVKQILQHVQVLELICQHSYWCLLVRMRKKKLFITFTMFVQRGGTAILESVTTEGKELPGCQGRLQNPG